MRHDVLRIPLEFAYSQTRSSRIASQAEDITKPETLEINV